MSHSTKVTIIADQYINICGKKINIHDLKSITLDGYGQAVGYVADDPKVSIIVVGEKKFKVTKRYIKVDSKNNIWQSDGLIDMYGDMVGWEICEGEWERYKADAPKEEFNSVEDYFEDVIGDNLPKGDTVNDCPYRVYKCKICGWMMTRELFISFPIGCEPNNHNKMRDHVYLKHNMRVRSE